MVRTRQEIRKLGDTWNDTVLWYAKAVAKLSPLPITRKTSWRYLAAMHDFTQDWWIELGYLTEDEELPPDSEQQVYWKQCQHGSWYFTPWHRAYLLSFEAIVQDTIVSLGGPADWSLPYWNYNGAWAGASDIPPAFLAPTLPDGSENYLNVAARYPSGIPAHDIDLRPALTEDTFTGGSGGPAPGFGGPETPFSRGGQDHGLLESMPHDNVHGDVGGNNGLMSYPDSAALDPIFWLHHANIDRLWEVWRLRDAEDKNPTETDWLDGPTDRVFALFDAQGDPIACNPRDMVSLAALGYEYDDVSDPFPGETRRGVRLSGFADAEGGAASFSEEPAVSEKPKFELLGSNDREVPIGAEPVTSRVAIAASPQRNVAASFTASAVAEDQPGEPDRVFLVLENIRGKEDSQMLDVYVRAPGQTEEMLAGSVGLFGVDAASDPAEHHGGAGLNKTLEVTDMFDKLRLEGAAPDQLEVRIAARHAVGAEDQIRVGQISLHRQSAP